MIDLSKVRNYYVACGYTDLRRGIDGLSAVASLFTSVDLHRFILKYAIPNWKNR